MNDVEEYLKKRLLIDENQNVNTKFDELVSTVKMLVKEKCREQRLNCGNNIKFIRDDKCKVITGVKTEFIINAKEPEL